MATYSSRRRIKSAYENTRGYYLGFGPVDCIPIRIKISTHFRQHKMWVMLTVNKWNRKAIRSPCRE